MSTMEVQLWAASCGYDSEYCHGRATDVGCELEASWESEASFGLSLGGTSETEAGVGSATPFKTEVYICLPWGPSPRGLGDTGG